MYLLPLAFTSLTLEPGVLWRYESKKTMTELHWTEVDGVATEEDLLLPESLIGAGLPGFYAPGPGFGLVCVVFHRK